jgi:DNA-binding response OmpR family regulator
MELKDTVIVNSDATATGKKVFLVEDDTDLYELVRYNLSREGFQVSGARTGKDSVELCERTRPDLILLDVMLPDSDGFEICRKLKAHYSLAHVPVIFLTARGSESDRVLGLELGAIDYMVKPFSVRELAARVKTHLRQQQEQPMPVLRIGGLELDRYRHRVRLDGRDLALTATEFRLLDYLMSRPGLVLTRGQLLDGVWGRADALTERVIDVYVLRLRGKIEPEGATQKFIRSVRGYGYSFEDPERLTVDRAS